MAKKPKISDLPSFKLSGGKEIHYYSLPGIELDGTSNLPKLPFSIRVVLESLLRNVDGKRIKEKDVAALLNFNAKNPGESEILFKVSRILMQDFTGVPAIVDLAAMRDHFVKTGKSAELIQPLIPTDLIIDHSVQVDAFNVPNAIEINQKMELERNRERYSLLKWGSKNLKDLRVFPPSAGICHQVNLEYIATCVTIKKDQGAYLAFPDTLVGTDSHTTMINGMGVVGFGVGGIEAEAAMLGEPVPFATPKVLGVELKGKLREGATATDFALTLTRLLRSKGVVGMFVEFFGEGVKNLSLPDRATLSNMCPEYGATIALFPVDEETLRYMKSTGRSAEQIRLIRSYFEAQEMFNINYKKVEYGNILKVDLNSIEPSVSGPTQPKQQLSLRKIKENFIETFMAAAGDLQSKPKEKISSKDYTRWASESLAVENGRIKRAPLHAEQKSVKIKYNDGCEAMLSDGDVVIASLTSCTNTSNPSVMLAAGLLAENALEEGLSVNTRKVKTSLGPGSRVVTRYLKKARLLEPLAKLGFGLVGFGCITCIGNSGPLIDKQSDAINAHNLTTVSVLSGNRNYEARIHGDVRANYLMSPPLVVAFAIAGTVLKDLSKEPLAKNRKGKDVYLKDIWPKQKDINRILRNSLNEEMFSKEYGNNIYSVNPYWNNLKIKSSELYDWNEDSTYIRLPPFFSELNSKKVTNIKDARVLAVFGDSISTDHISPAGEISAGSPAGEYLIKHKVAAKDFNTYGSRRGNHEVMMRGTFANNRIKNLMLAGTEGGSTIHYPDNKVMSVFDAAMKYKEENVPLIVIAGIEYGSGSSRDWAAKGPMLLGVKAVIAKSFERIHRSNLIGVGVLPLQFRDSEDTSKLKIDYSKPLSIAIPKKLEPNQKIHIEYTKTGEDKKSKAYVISRLDAQIEIEYYEAGGVLNYVLKNIAV